MSQGNLTLDSGTNVSHLSAAILSDDNSLCMMLQHMLEMSRAPTFTLQIISPINCSPTTFAQHDVVFFDRSYGAQPFIQTITQLYNSNAKQRKTLMIMVLDEHELNRDLSLFSTAIKNGIDALILRSELSQKTIRQLIEEHRLEMLASEQNNLLAPRQPTSPPSSNPHFNRSTHETVPHRAAEQADMRSIHIAHENTATPSTASQQSTYDTCRHTLSIDFENQFIHIAAAVNSPIFNQSDTQLSLTDWQTKLNTEGAAQFADLLRGISEYKSIPRTINCTIADENGTPHAAEITAIQIENNGQGRATSARAELTIKSNTLETLPEQANTVRPGFDNLIESVDVMAHEKIWEQVAQSLPALCFLLDESGRIARVISNDVHLTQHLPMAAPGLRLAEILEVDALDNLVENIQRTLNTGKEHQQSITYASNQGLRWLDTYITKLKGDAGLSRQVVWSAVDITATRHAYQELLKNHDATRQSLDDAPIMFFQKDSSGRFLQANKRFCQYFNVRADIISGRDDDEVFRDSMPKFKQLTSLILKSPGNAVSHRYDDDHKPQNSEPKHHVSWQGIALTQPDGSQVESIVGYGFISDSAIGNDVNTTAANNTELDFGDNITQINTDNDLDSEAMGIAMTGALGRDFKEILSGIVNYTEVALSQKNQAREQRIADHLEEVLKTAAHAYELVAHKSSGQVEKKGTTGTALQPLVTEILDMMRPTMPASLTLKTEIDETTGSALIAETPFKQIVMQLLISARNTALAAQQENQPQGEDQQIVLSLSNKNLPATECSACTEVLEGDYIVLSVHTKTADISTVDLQKLLKAAKSATHQNSADNVVAMAHNNNGHAVIEQLNDGLALQLVFKKA